MPLPTRRSFLTTSAIGLAAASLAPRAFTAGVSSPPAWTIGCLNRPWVKWSLDEALDGVKAAGYTLVGLQTPTAADPFVASGASPAYLASVKQKIAARRLMVNVGRLRTKDAAPFADATADIRQQVENARTLGLTTLINTGTGKVDHYDAWYRLMAYAAAFAGDHGIQVVTKPHGGVNAAAAEILVCLEKINHRNLGIWYDAGNIIHYTGKDPLQELETIIAHVTAFTAKDCADKGAEVMTQFGTGKVDFAALLRRLKKAGFKGPIMVESCAVADTPAATTANARANRVFLESIIARI